MTKILCIYHGFCDDGFAAALAVRRALGEDVEFYPGVYGKPPPDVTGRDVLMVDFSYKRPVIDDMAQVARSIVILDHHKTARDDLSGIMKPETTAMTGTGIATYTGLTDCIVTMSDEVPNIRALFDMERSGAGLAWDFFHPSEERPEFINYIEDRDLWRKKLEFGDEFTIALRSYVQDFTVWEGLIARGVPALISEGHAIQRYYRVQVEALKKEAYIGFLPRFADVPAAFVNAPYAFASEVAGEIVDLGGAKYGVCFFERADGRIQYSLRSRSDFDVSEVAKTFGGGGHAGAAGFDAAQVLHVRRVESGL